MSKPKELGLKFYTRTTDLKWHDACAGCGTVRRKGKSDYSFGSDQFCRGCGKSYAESVLKTTPVYVIGVFIDYLGRKGYQLSTTKPENIEENINNGEGYSYWSYLIEELGKEYHLTKKEAEL